MVCLSKIVHIFCVDRINYFTETKIWFVRNSGRGTPFRGKKKKIDKKYTCSSCSQEQWEQEREREKGIRSEEFSHSKTLITARPSTRWMSSNAIYHRQKERESISRSGMLSDQSRTIRRCERSHYDDDDDDNNHYDRLIWWDIHVAFIISFLVEPSTRPLGLPRRLLLL